MCSLISPSCTGLRKQPSSDVGSPLNANCDAVETELCSKLMLLNLKKSRLEAQVTFYKTQIKLAEMEVHLVEIEICHELWKKESKSDIHPPKVQPTKRKRVLARQVRQRVRPCFRISKRYNTQGTQASNSEIIDYTNVNENEQLNENYPVDNQSHHKQVGELNQGEDLENGQISKKVKLSNSGAQETDNGISPDHNDRSVVDQRQLDVTGAACSTGVTENVENRVVTRDAELVADTDARHASRSDKNTRDKKKKSKSKNKNDVRETNTEKSSSRSHSRERKSKSKDSKISKTEDQKAEKICNNLKDKVYDANSSNTAMIRSNLNKTVSLEMNNDDISTQNAEPTKFAVKWDFSKITDIESTGRQKHMSSRTEEANANNVETEIADNKTSAIYNKNIREETSHKLQDMRGKLFNNKNKMNALVAASVAGSIYSRREYLFSNNI